MNFAISDTFMSGLLRDMRSARTLTSGTKDDNDDRDDEHSGENEASVRALDENIEGPEEFSVGDEDELQILEFDVVREDD
jgi:hypothetical protein